MSKENIWDIADEVVIESHVDNIEDIEITIKPCVQGGTLNLSDWEDIYTNITSGTISGNNYYWSYDGYTTWKIDGERWMAGVSDDNSTNTLNGIDVKNLCWDFSNFS